MEILGKIVGNPARVKIMKLFLLNKDKSFSSKEVAKRTRVSADSARREVKLLSSAGFLKKKGADWVFNNIFRYAKELENLLIVSDTPNSDSIINNFKKAGKTKLLIVSGIFIKNKDSQVDILIVGDKMKKSQVEEGIRKLEAEIGTELSYAVFDTKEFIYRVNMYDKLVRDILDFPHQVILQAKELSALAEKKT